MILQQLLDCNKAKKALFVVAVLALLPSSFALPTQQAQRELATRYEQNILAPTSNRSPTNATTILDVLGQHHEFSKLLETILKDKELKNLLGDSGSQPTLFAPTNEAFDSLTDIRIPTRDLLMYHISPYAYNLAHLRVEPIIQSMYESKGLDGSAQYLRIAPGHPTIPSTTLPLPPFWQMEPEWVDDDDLARQADEVYVNRAKVVKPDLMTLSGGIVHGVNRLIQPPADTILDEILHHHHEFSTLAKAWKSTEVDAHIRDGKSLTLFAAPDKAWKALPKKLKKWLFSPKGKEHLKIFTMYMVGDRTLYTPEIFNRTNKDGSKSPDYKDIEVQSLLNAPAYKLHVKGQLLRTFDMADTLNDLSDYFQEEERLAKDLVHAALHELEVGSSKKDDKDDKHHYPHRNPNHRHHHDHKKHKHHKDHDHKGGGHGGNPPSFERNEILVNNKAKIEHGLENWIAGNGVIHVIDRVLMPPRKEGCKRMTPTECEAWQHMWGLASEEEEGGRGGKAEELGENYFDETGKELALPWIESSTACLYGNFEHCGLAQDVNNMYKPYKDEEDEGHAELEGGWF